MKILVRTLSVLICASSYAQDTIIYAQKDAVMFSNRYYLIKDKLESNSGTFYQISKSDDLQYWYGAGTFIETKKRIELDFNKSMEGNRAISIQNSQRSDSLAIRWFDWWKQPQVWFKVRPVDPESQKEYSDQVKGLIKIAKTDLGYQRLGLFQGSQKIFEFDVTSDIDEIQLYVNPSFAHVINKDSEVLTKKGEVVYTKGIWTKKRREKFIREK